MTVPSLGHSFQRALARYSAGFDALRWLESLTVATAVHVSSLRPILEPTARELAATTSRLRYACAP